MKIWIKINDDACGTYDTSRQIKLKTTMLKSILCDYGGAYILVKGTITVIVAEADVASRQAKKRNEKVLFKNCAPFTNCIS